MFYKRQMMKYLRKFVKKCLRNISAPSVKMTQWSNGQDTGLSPGRPGFKSWWRSFYSFSSFSGFFRVFQGFSKGEKGVTILSYTYGTLYIQPQILIAITDVNPSLAPLCTSEEFQVEILFTIEIWTKMQKLLKKFIIFEKNSFIPKSLW